MTRRFLLCVMILSGFMAVIAGIYATVLYSYQEGVYARKPHHDFGEIRQKEIVEHQFELMNRHSFPVSIHNVIESCSCSVIEYPRGKYNRGSELPYQ